MEKVTYTYLRKNLSSILNKVVDDCDDHIVVRPNGKRIALVDADDYASMKETLHLFSNPANSKRIIEATERAQKGEGVEIDNIQDYFRSL